MEEQRVPGCVRGNAQHDWGVVSWLLKWTRLGFQNHGKWQPPNQVSLCQRGSPCLTFEMVFKKLCDCFLDKPFVCTNVVLSALFASPMPFQSRLIVCYGRPINFDMLLTSAGRAVCLTSPADLFIGVSAQFPNPRESKRSSVLILEFSRYIAPLEYRRFKTLHRQFSTSRYPVTKPPTGLWNLVRGMSCQASEYGPVL
jgi:hypothetical protein